jgi:hypothetical protein
MKVINNVKNNSNNDFNCNIDGRLSGKNQLWEE